MNLLQKEAVHSLEVSSVQDGMVTYALGKAHKKMYALHSVSQSFCLHCLFSSCTGRRTGNVGKKIRETE